MWVYLILRTRAHSCWACVANLAYRSDPMWWIHFSPRAMETRVMATSVSSERKTNTRLSSFFSRASPVHGPMKYNLWQNERTLLVKQIQLRADINDPICMPRGKYFAIIRARRNAWLLHRIEFRAELFSQLTDVIIHALPFKTRSPRFITSFR